MQGFLKGKIEMHGPGRVVGVLPGLRCQLIQGRRGMQMQPISGALCDQAADGTQELLLIHRLVGTSVLETSRAISREQQQGQTGTIGFNSRRQQIGHRCSGGGYHRCSRTSGETEAKGQKRR